VEIHNVLDVMREMTEGELCYLCNEQQAAAALFITKRDNSVQDAPVVPICQSCMNNTPSIDWIHERMDRELSEGKLKDLPIIRVEPAMVIRTDKPPEVVESAIRHLGDAVVQQGSLFEIVEEDHPYFFKPDGRTSIHYFRDTNFVMQVTQDERLVDGIEFFGRSPWDDVRELMHIITESHKFAIETISAPNDKEEMFSLEDTATMMTEWLKELVWWRVQRAIEVQQSSSRMSSLARALPPEGLKAAIGALLEERDDCDCALCTARRAAMGEQDMDEEPAPGETIH
jgi:hypothetical protein